MTKKIQTITANIPRIVCDFPYYKKDYAQKLEFNHRSILNREDHCQEAWVDEGDLLSSSESQSEEDAFDGSET